MKMKNGYLFHCVNERYFSVNVDTKIANVLHVFEIINHNGYNRYEYAYTRALPVS